MPKTRYDITLDTGTSTDVGANENYFDQVTALSQGIINASFRQLFDSVEGVAEIAFASKLLGRFDAVLDAPSIMINGLTTNATEVMYILRIKSGTFVFVDKKKLEIHDWVLALPTKINELSLDITPGDSDNAKSRKKRWIHELKRNYPGFVPGDYTAQRIFCALGSAGWNDPDDKESTVWDPVTKSTMNFRTFLNREDNSMYKDIMVTMLKGWATAEGEDAVGTMGIKFKLPEANILANTPTFRPVHIYNQVYPYLKDDNDRGGMSMGDYSMALRTLQEPYGKLKDGDYNCLLYCENVDRSMGQKQAIVEDGVTKLVDQVIARPLPINLKLGHNGNLAEPGIYGSFVMDHRVFMTTFLLPQLQELSLATYMQIGLPDRSYSKEKNSAWIYPKYAIGRELEGNTPRPASDPFFKLDRVGDTRYRWTKDSFKHGLQDIFSFARPETPNNFFSHNNYDIVAKSTVEAEWETGTPRMKIWGEIEYDYYTSFSSSKDMKTNLEEYHYKCTGKWNIALVIKNVEKKVMVNGQTVVTRVLMPEIEGVNKPDNTPTDMLLDYKLISENNEIKDTTTPEIKKQLNEGLSRGISVVVNNLEKRFQHSGKFSYPGHGELEFTDPKFTRLGSIIATVNYKPPSGPNGSMYFPPKAKHEDLAMDEPSIPDPKTSTFAATLQHDAEPLLEWYTDFKYNEHTRIGRLTLEATNRMRDQKGNGVDLAFGSICISLEHTPNKDDDGKVRQPKLFSEQGWRPDHDGIMDDIYGKGKALLKVLTKYMAQEPEPPSEQPKTQTQTQPLAPSADPGEKTDSTAPVDGPKDTAAVTVPVSEESKSMTAEEKKDSTVAVPAAAAVAENQPVDHPETPRPTIATGPATEPVTEPATQPSTDPSTESSTQPATPPTPPPAHQPEPTRWRWVEKVKETYEEQKGNVYTFERKWDIDDELPSQWYGSTSEVALDIAVSMDRALEFTVLPANAEESEETEAPTGFVVPYNKKLRLELQGEVSELGQYAIKVQETWKKMEQGRLKEGKYATDWKMVSLKKGANGKVEYEAWDVSERLAAEAKRAADAAAAAAKK